MAYKFRTIDENKTCLRQAILTLVRVGKVSATWPLCSDWRLRSLAAISLLVGGAGILALMLMSVKERTGEIGLRMAVGARPGNILIQFLLEATLLSLGGWVVGMALGAAAASAVASSTDWKVAVPVNAIVASLAMAAMTGIGFGWYPARKASLVPPIQALLAE